MWLGRNRNLQNTMQQAGVAKEARRTAMRQAMKRYLGNVGLLTVIIVICCLLSLISPVFLTKTNLINLLIQSVILMTLALGVTFVILTGGIDLSIAGIMTVSSVLSLGLIVHQGVPAITGIAIALVIGAGFGLINGVLIAKFHLPRLS